ncbi:MAG: hypothetical protein N2053_04705 [Chitinispirillaceae bacterium]|nr:hypothetical protein [Chitinispirillaceae bacterium]
MLEEIIKSIPLNILVIKIDGTIEYSNLTFCERDPSEICGCSIEKIIPSDYVSRDLERWVRHSCETNQSVKLDVKLKDGSFNFKKYRIYISPMDQKKAVTTWIDLDEYHINLNDESLEKKKESEEVFKAKIEAINILSHEIRTPLTSMLSMAEFLSLKVKDSTLVESIEIIKAAAERLKNLLLNIMDFTTDTFSYSVKQIGFSLHTIAEQIRYRHIASAEKSKTSLNVNCKVKEGTLLAGNEIYLWRIINTILISALRHIKNGNIELNIIPVTIKEKKISVRFEIKIEGEGDFKYYLSKIEESAYFPTDNLNLYGDITYSFSLLNVLISEMNGKIMVLKETQFTIVLEFPFEIVNFFEKREGG